MKICVYLVFLTTISYVGCSMYNLKLKPVEKSFDFNNDLKLQADLNKEFEQGLLKMNLGASSNEFDHEPNIHKLPSDASPEMTLTYYEKKAQRATSPNETNKQSSVNFNTFVGTSLFDSYRKKCFSSEDVALLSTRKHFETLVPKQLPQCLLNDDMICTLMQYFYKINKRVQKLEDECSKFIAERAFYDTLGGYLNYYVLPVTKISFYGGQASLKTVENIIKLYKQCKTFLNTNGNGWRTPLQSVLTDLQTVRIAPLKIKKYPEDNEEPSCCVHLDLSSVNNDAEDDQMIVSLPKLEPEDCDGFLGNIWLPFKRKRTFNLRSSKSAYIVVKFYETVTRCYRFQSMCQDTYNRKFKSWILENIHVHLSDEQFYPGLGAILRIYENLRRGKKSLNEIIKNEYPRNLEENKNSKMCEKNNHDAKEKENDEKTNEEATNIEEDDQFYDLEPEVDTEVDEDIRANEEERKLEFDVGEKTEKYRKIENKVKQMGEDGTSWFERTYGSDDSRERAYTETRTIDTDSQRLYIKYACIFIAIILFFLILSLCISKRKSKKRVQIQPSPKPIRQCTNRLPPTPKDEEILIKPESASVVSSSSSELALHPKCPKCCKVCSKRDYSTTKTYTSSSETENKNNSKSFESQKSQLQPNSKRQSQEPQPKMESQVQVAQKEPLKCTCAPVPINRFGSTTQSKKNNQKTPPPKPPRGSSKTVMEKDKNFTRTSKSWETVYETESEYKNKR